MKLVNAFPHGLDVSTIDRFRKDVEFGAIIVKIVLDVIGNNKLNNDIDLKLKQSIIEAIEGRHETTDESIGWPGDTRQSIVRSGATKPICAWWILSRIKSIQCSEG